MSENVCAICNRDLQSIEIEQNRRFCSTCENILISKHDKVFEILYAESKCSLHHVQVGDYVNYMPDSENARKELNWKIRRYQHLQSKKQDMVIIGIGMAK